MGFFRPVWKCEYTTHGITVEVEVSPCSWMYANYGFQFGYKANDGSSAAYCNRNGLTCEDATPADVQAMLDALTVGACDKCGRPHLVNPDSNRGETCEECFVTAIIAELKMEQAKEDKRKAAEDAKMKVKGYRYKTVAWVHPSAGGDDYQVVMYTVKRPLKAEVQAMLKKKRSSILDDYNIAKL